jgi:murein L,D-transpeptidase YafK
LYAPPTGRGAATVLPAGSVDHLEASKSEGRLVAFGEGQPLRSYRAAFGRGGAGPKTYEGDEKTPEGLYRVDARHHSARFHRFLHVSYPNADDVARFERAKRRGEVPAGRGIGSAIGIHGESDKALVRALNNRVDWTLGCIAVSDEAAEELFTAVRTDATIAIRP